jgi:hypothetical protein
MDIILNFIQELALQVLALLHQAPALVSVVLLAHLRLQVDLALSPRAVLAALVSDLQLVLPAVLCPPRDSADRLALAKLAQLSRVLKIVSDRLLSKGMQRRKAKEPAFLSLVFFQ